MWSKERAVAVGVITALVPDEVLYYYDGPILFIQQMGVFTALVYKFDEDDASDTYLISQIDQKTLGSLKNGQISLRGALVAPTYWIAETRTNLTVQRAWQVKEEDFPDEFLPARGLGLQVGMFDLPDNIEQATAFFSVKFTGPDLRSGSMSFKLFKSLTDQVYSLTQKLLTPSTLVGKRSSDLFDWPLAQPQFASLLIAVRPPRIDAALAQEWRSKNKLSAAENYLLSSMNRRETFFQSVGEMAAEAIAGDLSDDSMRRNFSLLSSLSDIIPGERSPMATTEFTANTGDTHQRIMISRDTGIRLRLAYERAATRPVQVAGRVEMVNNPARLLF